MRETGKSLHLKHIRVIMIKVCMLKDAIIMYNV